MTAILRPDAAARLVVTKEDATRLNAAWVSSFEAGAAEQKRSAGASSASAAAVAGGVTPDVDYFAMINS